MTALDYWYVEIWPKKGSYVSEILRLSDQEVQDLGDTIRGFMDRKLVKDFTLDRWEPMPVTEFQVRVLDRIKAGTLG